MEFELKVRKTILLLVLLLSYTPLLAQVDSAWVKRFNGSGNSQDEAYDVAVDKNRNIYVTGYSTSTGASEDLITIKYNSNGDTLWVRKYNGPGNGKDIALDLALDDSGNVYVAGYSMGSGTNFCYTTIKYDSLGDTLWVRHYNGPANAGDRAYAIAVDDSGNAYVTGFSVGSTGTTDYLTIKYSPIGDTLWTRPYNGPGNSYDYAYAIAVDTGRNVYVTGLSTGSSTNHDYATIKYTSSGDIAWVRRYNGPGNFVDDAYDLAVDKNGNVHVTGFSIGLGSAVDDYATIKYNSIGDSLWTRRYNGPGSGGDEAFAITVDTSGNVYVTGYSDSDTGMSKANLDYLTIKYSAIGDTLWTRRYNGPGNGNDEAYAVALDDSGNIYVTGYSDLDPTATLNQDYATAKYSSDGTREWVIRYNGSGDAADIAYALAVDDSGNVYVTGRSWGGDAEKFDFTTIKYIPIACIAKAGDANNDNSVLLSDVVATINFLFRFQPLPPPVCRADANGNGKVLLPDAVYLINFIFKAGPAPVKNRECCL